MRRNQEESRIQKACVKWFRYKYPNMSKLLYSIPNGGYRNKSEASTLKAEGVVSGVADLFLSAPHISRFGTKWHGLYIEMKRKGTYQSKEQKEFQRQVESVGFRYEVVRSFDEFELLINHYLDDTGADNS